MRHRVFLVSGALAVPPNHQSKSPKRGWGWGWRLVSLCTSLKRMGNHPCTTKLPIAGSLNSSGCGSKPMVPFWVGEFTTHFRRYDLVLDAWPSDFVLSFRRWRRRTRRGWTSTRAPSRWPTAPSRCCGTPRCTLSGTAGASGASGPRGLAQGEGLGSNHPRFWSRGKKEKH